MPTAQKRFKVIAPTNWRGAIAVKGFTVAITPTWDPVKKKHVTLFDGHPCWKEVKNVAPPADGKPDDGKPDDGKPDDGAGKKDDPLNLNK